MQNQRLFILFYILCKSQWIVLIVLQSEKEECDEYRQYLEREFGIKNKEKGLL